MKDSSYHKPVLLDEVLSFLPVDPGGIYVDGTLGGGGHAIELIKKLSPSGLLVGLDQDPDALAEAERNLSGFGSRIKIVKGNFGRMRSLLDSEKIDKVDGILLDLGVSSHQLDEGRKGFSFMHDGPLDMRMDPEAKLSARELVNEASDHELIRIFRNYGEEPKAGRAVGAIMRARKKQPIETTGQLANLIEEALGRKSHKHPATKIFQALRMAVNRELDVLNDFLGDLKALLAPGGRVVIISYHSLEDRAVKKIFRDAEPHCRCPREQYVCTCGEPGWLRVLNRKVVKPSRTEIQHNSRARSAKLRAAERLGVQ